MKLSSFLLALAGIFATPLALAQTAPTKPPAKAAAKPAPKPAAAAPSPAEGKTLAIGGGNTTTGSVLSREELRACFSAEESIRSRLAEQDGARGPLDQEKQAIAADQEALRAQRAPLDDLKKKSEAFAVTAKQFTTRVQSWTERVEAHNASNSGSPGYDRRTTALNSERDLIAKEREGIEAERARLANESGTLVSDYNSKVAALEARVQAWNNRNAEWNDTVAALESERKTWVAGCANRRYREDDETAIRSGK